MIELGKQGVYNCRLLTMEEGYPYYDNGALVWDDDGILLAAGDLEKVRENHIEVEWRDLFGHFVMPGLVCAHGHLYSSLARGISLKDEAPENFGQILERLWWRLDKALDKRSIEDSALIGLLDSVRAGTTTYIDHHASPNSIEGSLDLIAEAALKVGLRVCTCYEVSDRDGIQKRDAAIEENLRFIEAYPPGKHPSISSAFGLHASFTLDTESLNKVASVKPEEVGIHIHCCEAMEDCSVSKQKYGSRPISRLKKSKLLDSRSLLVHCVHLNKREREVLAEKGAKVIHNPMSNMNNAVGIAPVLDFMERGIPVALGTDGYSSSVFDEYSVATTLHKLAAKDPRKAFSEPARMLFDNNKKLASPLFKNPVGTLEAGSCADFLIMDYEPPTPLSTENVLGHLCMGLSRIRPSEVVIGGNTIVRNGLFASFDSTEIASRARETAKGLWERF